MAEKYRGLRLAPAGSGGRLAQVVDAAVARYRTSMDALAIHDGAAAAFSVLTAVNEFIAETAPWALAKDAGQQARLAEVLFEAAEATRVATVLLAPVMPGSCAAILPRLGDSTPFTELRLDQHAGWRAAGTRDLVKGESLWPRFAVSPAAADLALGGEAPTVAIASAPRHPARAKSPFARADHSSPKESLVDESTATGAPVAQPAAGTPESPAPATASGTPAAVPASTAPAADARIAIDDFMKVELRVAKVRHAESVPKSKKLIRLTVDVGEAEPRTILAGIAEAYQPDQLIGRTIAIVANLKPAKLMGIESNGMVLAASPDGGLPSLVALDDSLPAGARIR
jgi:methionyl-tRNA synthetase